MVEQFKQVENKEVFQKMLDEAGSKPVFVDFFATWCGKCEMMMPELEAIAQANSDKGVFLKVDIEENEEVAELY